MPPPPLVIIGLPFLSLPLFLLLLPLFLVVSRLFWWLGSIWDVKKLWQFGLGLKFGAFEWTFCRSGKKREYKTELKMLVKERMREELSKGISVMLANVRFFMLHRYFLLLLYQGLFCCFFFFFAWLGQFTCSLYDVHRTDCPSNQTKLDFKNHGAEIHQNPR